MQNLTELWTQLGLTSDGNGRPYPNAANAIAIVRKHPAWEGRFWLDEFRQRIRTVAKQGSRDWRDSDDIELLVFCQTAVGIPRMTIDAVRSAVVRVADGDRRDEVRDWICGLKWDGAPRLCKVMTIGFGADDTDLAMVAGEILFKSLAQRARAPGSQVDIVVIFEGGQGIRKSTALRVIGGPYYGSLHSQIGSKDILVEMLGLWLVELTELESLSRRDAEAIKAFITQLRDRYRPHYGRHAIEVPRRCVFAGSTNDAFYLRDPTGARRFVPVRCGRIDVAWLEEHREQLFAEAWHRVVAGETWWELPDQEAERERDARYESDSWHEVIELYLRDKNSTTMAELLAGAVKLDISRQDKRAQMRAAVILGLIGWHRVQFGPNRRRLWRRVEGGSGGSQVVQLKSSLIQSTEPLEPHEPHNAL